MRKEKIEFHYNPCTDNHKLQNLSSVFFFFFSLHYIIYSMTNSEGLGSQMVICLLFSSLSLTSSSSGFLSEVEKHASHIPLRKSFNLSIFFNLDFTPHGQDSQRTSSPPAIYIYVLSFLNLSICLSSILKNSQLLFFSNTASSPFCFSFNDVFIGFMLCWTVTL